MLKMGCKYYLLAILPFTLTLAVQAQGVDTNNLEKISVSEEIQEGNVENKENLGNVMVVTANRYVEPLNKTEASIETIDKRQIFDRQSRSLPEALKLTSGVMIQKTSNGQGSPYLRGFTGFGTLMLVDGIPLNCSINRSGPNQYWTTIDMWSIENIEILKGSASALYGSDAIGGTVQAFTLMPEYSEDPDGTFGGRYRLRASSAEESLIGRIEQSYATPYYALLMGFTYKDFGDVHAAKIGRQRKTGYDELNYDIKLRVNLAGDRELVLGHYYTDLDDVWRTHRTPYSNARWEGTTVGNKESIHIFDNDRMLSYIQYFDNEEYRFASSIHATLYHQRQYEVLTKQKLGKKKIYDDETDVNTVGALLDLTKESDWGTWAYGFSYVLDFVDSEVDDESSPLYNVQGSNPDDSRYHVLAAYVQDRFYITDDIDFTLGTRLTYTYADIGSYYNKKKSGPNKADSFSEDWTHWCSSARLGYNFLEKKGLLYTSVAQGFRTPNLTDLARNGDFASGSKEVPTTDVDPETYLTGEIGFRYAIDKFAFHTAYFYTDIHDQIIRVPETPGSSSQTKINGGEGYVHGAEAEVAVNPIDSLTLRAGLTIMRGSTDYKYRGERVHEPIRTMPTTAFAALRWDSDDDRFWAEIVGQLVDEEDRLSAGDKRDTQRIPPGGTPGYFLTDIRVGCRLFKNWQAVVAVENLFDEDYRVHGSGSNEPGRNFVCSLEYAW